jgi:hypothetical protein
MAEKNGLRGVGDGLIFHKTLSVIATALSREAVRD